MSEEAPDPEIEHNTITFRDLDKIGDNDLVPWHKVKEFVETSHRMTETSHDHFLRLLDLHMETKQDYIQTQRQLSLWKMLAMLSAWQLIVTIASIILFFILN
jgi:hypothetical protein